MTLIFNSLLLSMRVMLHMIVPVLVISLASVVVWTVLGIFTLGMANYISGPVTTAFFTLFGIRTALALKGDKRHTDYRAMALYSVMYGLFFAAVLWVMKLIVAVSGIAYALWQIGEPISWAAFQNVPKPALGAFGLLAGGSSLIVMCFVWAAFYAIMAVPIASAAQSAGHRAPSHAFFNGLGRSFIPLFCVFFVSIFLQLYFGFYTAFYALLPILMSVISILTVQSLPNFDLEIILRGAAAGGALLWLNSWLWSVCALAFLKFEGDDTVAVAAPSPDLETATDLRALRKSRERSF
ncbi:hypothetical protein [Ruegeria atlantica]|uniref:hypothetical protein n=1 Tax=Ruegeria atlantica TaxID=81569 RepID=UPI00249444BF|nr:hypothetical protein [Ruegeria atlantica]